MKYIFYSLSVFLFISCKIKVSSGNPDSSKEKEPLGITWTKDVPAKTDIINGHAFTYNDEIYVLTGQQGRFAKYNPVTYQWIDLAGLPGPRTEFGAALWNDKIIVAGGVNDSMQLLDRVDYYDLKLQVWKFMSSLPQGKAQFALNVHDNVLYTSGGIYGITMQSHTTCSEILYFQDSTKQWLLKTALAAGRSNHLGIYNKDVLFMIGGYGYTTKQGTEYINHQRREYSFKPDLPVSRGNIGGISSGDFIITFGGKVKSSNSPMEKLDIKNSKWIVLEDCPFWNDRFAYARWKDRVYVFGGSQSPRSVWKGDIQFKE